jgi:hypothetical protein
MVVEFTKSHCPACQQNVTFIYITDKKEQINKYFGHLFIYPGDEIRHPLKGIEDAENLQRGIKNAYFSTINVLNSREWNATSVLCRRVLEGITKSFIPEDLKNRTLAAQLNELPKHIDLSEPILTLADAIRKGGNLGAHFDTDKEPNDEVAGLMVDVLDYLIEYLFILPNRIKNLHDKIESISNDKQNAS